MKKYKILIILYFIGIITMAGCKNTAQDTFISNNLQNNINSDHSNIPSNTPLNISNSNNNENKIQFNEAFFGEWEVNNNIASGKVSMLSEDDIKILLNKKLILSNNEAKFSDNICRNPYYKKSSISEEQFFNEHGYVSFSQLGIKQKSITLVEVFSKTENYKNFWDCIGGQFILKDENTLIAIYGGEFFKLVRKK